MIDLQLYGWNETVAWRKECSNYRGLAHGRVMVTHKTCYEVIGEDGCYTCELTGSMLYGKPVFEYPCTGDWVIFQPFDANRGIIVDRLPRERTLYRRKSGTVADKQTMASYVDKAFIVQSLDEDFSVRRVERFMVQMQEEQIKPVLVLNKSDLDFDRFKLETQLQHSLRHIPVFTTSLYRPETLLPLRQYVGTGETVVFVGSSGVGKSSLINALCRKSVLVTSDISLSTGKGRHTSTRREMVLVEGGGVLIDTPGIREFGLTADKSDAISETLAVSGYAAACRFGDCTHTNEPDCAVLKAVDDGLLDRGVYQNYLKMQRESWHFTASVHEKRNRDRAFSKLIAQVKKRKDDF